MAEQVLFGKNITLRPATLHDRRPIFEWLVESDLTSQMLGAPTFPDNPAPTWEEFIDDYKEYFFDGTEPLCGRCFVIVFEGESIGQVNYNEIFLERSVRNTELDIWLKSSKYAGKGYGSDALWVLTAYLCKDFGCTDFWIAPSARNERAIRSYEKVGFEPTPQKHQHFTPDYHDAVVLVLHLDSQEFFPISR